MLFFAQEVLVETEKQIYTITRQNVLTSILQIFKEEKKDKKNVWKKI